MVSGWSLDSQEIELLKLCDVEHREAERLGEVMRALTAEAARLDAAVARRFGVSDTDLLALDVLGLAGGATPGQLAARLGLSSGAVTALVDRLAGHGLVERVPHPSDRRSTLLRLTDRAQGFAWEAYVPLAEEGAALLAGFSAAERAAILRFLDEAAAVTRRHADAQDAFSRGAARGRPAS
jgi:DNA-binding MarR family transcriptional regulator